MNTELMDRLIRGYTTQDLVDALAMMADAMNISTTPPAPSRAHTEPWHRLMEIHQKMVNPENSSENM